MNRTITKIAAILSLSVAISVIGQPAFAKTTFVPLKSGMQGPKVQEVETMLAALHFDYKLKVDKVYNKNTANNVSKFQKSAALKQTGVVNQATYDKLKQAYAKANKEKPANQQTTLKVGSSGAAVSDLQKDLKALGYSLTVNGSFDAATRLGVMIFQSRNNMPMNGEADSQTLSAISKQAKEQTGKPDPVTPPAPSTPSTPVQPQNPGAGQGTVVPLPDGLTADEQQMIQLVNQERTSRGLKPYQVDMNLEKVARLKAQDMVKNGYFSHTSPTYGSPFQMMDTFGINYRAAAENIAQNWAVASAHNSFMNSAGHKENILSPTYDYVAIAVVDGGPYGKTFVQMFVKY